MAKIGELLGLGSNPFYQGFASNRNAFSGAFSGMAANPMNPWGGFAQGAQLGGQMDYQLSELERQEAERAGERNATAEWLKAHYPQYSALPPAQGFQAAMADMSRAQSGARSNLMSVGGHIYDTESGQWISPPETADNRQNVSLTPQWGQDEQGNWVMLQPSSTGDLVRSAVPEGVSLVNPFDLNANKAGGSAYGKSVGGAQFDLPNAELTAQQTVSAINDVRAQTQGMDEHFGNILGIPQQVTPAWPGSAKANFQVAADRAINRAFLEGRAMLKGGGQITDFESRKAEAAITAAQTALEKGNKEMFLKALNDFEQAVNDGVAKLRGQAGGMPGYGGGAGGGNPSGGGFTILGVE